MFKKLIVAIILFILFVSTSSYGQVKDNLFIKERKEIKQLLVGQKVPEEFWSQSLTDISTKSDKIVKVANFKGKAIIIDFWASWCHPCLNNIPKLDSISRIKDYGFQPIMINTMNRIDSLKNMREFIRGFLEDKPNFHSPMTLYNPIIQAFFPHKMVPHYVWIGSDGVIKAITDHKFINVANIKILVSGGNLDLITKIR